MLTLHWGGLKGEDFFREVLINRPPAVPTPSGGLLIGILAMSDRLQEVKLFPELNPEAVNHAVLHGVAKVPKFLGQSALEFLNYYFSVDDEEDIMGHGDLLSSVPEFQAFSNHIYTAANIERGMDMQISNVDQSACEAGTKSHKDSPPIPGISVLMPFFGPQALFAASDELFGLIRRTLEPNPHEFNAPRWLTAYGPGDAIILRQSLGWYNDIPVELGQVQHAAAGADLRKIAIADFITKDLVIDTGATA